MALKEAAEPRPSGHIAPLDEVDRRIAAALRAEGRLSMRALADRLHLKISQQSWKSVRQRILPVPEVEQPRRITRLG